MVTTKFCSVLTLFVKVKKISVKLARYKKKMLIISKNVLFKNIQTEHMFKKI